MMRNAPRTDVRAQLPGCGKARRAAQRAAARLGSRRSNPSSKCAANRATPTSASASRPLELRRSRSPADACPKTKKQATPSLQNLRLCASGARADGHAGKERGDGDCEPSLGAAHRVSVPHTTLLKTAHRTAHHTAHHTAHQSAHASAPSSTHLVVLERGSDHANGPRDCILRERSKGRRAWRKLAGQRNDFPEARDVHQ
eukprot:386055-Rhodomonas_salina.2